MSMSSGWGTNTLLETLQMALAELRTRWKLVVLLPTAAILIAIIYVLFTPRSWIGDVLLEIGQFAPVSANTGVHNPAGGLIEPLAAVASLVQNSPFKSTVIRRMGLDPESSNEKVQAIYNNLEARIPAGVSFLRLYLYSQGDSEFNREVLETAAQLVIERHAELVKQRRAAIEQQLKWISGELESQERLAQQALAVPDGKGQDPIVAFLSASLREQFAARLLQRLWELRRDQATIQAALTSITQSDTRTSSPVLVKRVLRGGAIIVSMAAVGSLTFAIVLVLLGVGRTSRAIASATEDSMEQRKAMTPEGTQ